MFRRLSIILIVIIFSFSSCSTKQGFHFQEPKINLSLEKEKCRVQIKTLGNVKGIVWTIPQDEKSLRCIGLMNEGEIVLEFYKPGIYEIEARVGDVRKTCLVEVEAEK